MPVLIRGLTWGRKYRVKPINVKTKPSFLANYVLHWHEDLGRTVSTGAKLTERSFYYHFPQKYFISFIFFIHWLQKFLWQLVIAEYTAILWTFSNSNSKSEIQPVNFLNHILRNSIKVFSSTFLLVKDNPSMAQTQILPSWAYIPMNNLFKCQLQFSKPFSCLWILNICNKYLFWECFTFMTLDLLMYTPQNLSFKYHASRKSDHFSSSHLQGPISNISSGLHKVMDYKSLSATHNQLQFAASKNTLLMEHLVSKAYLNTGKIVNIWLVVCIYAHRLSATTECKYVLFGWLGLKISTPAQKPLSSVTI